MACRPGRRFWPASGSECLSPRDLPGEGHVELPVECSISPITEQYLQVSTGASGDRLTTGRAGCYGWEGVSPVSISRRGGEGATGFPAGPASAQKYGS